MTDMAQADRTLRHTPSDPAKHEEVFNKHRERMKAVNPTNPDKPFHLEIEIKSVYGKYLYYPRNQAAYTLADIAGTDTLTQRTLELAKRLGFSISFNHQMPEGVAHL
jgi:hypothetical protein